MLSKQRPKSIVHILTCSHNSGTDGIFDGKSPFADTEIFSIRMLLEISA